MAIPAYITFIVNGNALKGSVTFPGWEGTSEAHEFSHSVRFIDQDWFSHRVTREHAPIVFVKVVDAVSVTLYKLLSTGSIIDKVQIDWLRYNDQTSTEEVYFRHIIEKAKICSIEMFMPHVKNSRFERCPHLERIALRYDRIAWHVPQGTIQFADRWLYGLLLEGMNTRDYDELNAMMEQEAVTDALFDDEDEQPKERLSVTNPRWEHTDGQLKKNSPNVASPGHIIKLAADIKGYAPAGKVAFDIYDVSESTPQLIDTVYGKNTEGVACAEWTIEVPRKEGGTSELKLAFEASARSKYSERKEIPLNTNSFTVRLFINPETKEAQDDKYILLSSDERVRIEKNVKDDKIPGDDFLDLEFTGIEEDREYSLIIDQGEGTEPFYSFAGVKGSQLLSGDEEIIYDESEDG